jgi:hypothetical protein
VSFSFIYTAFNNIPVPDFRNYERGQGASDFRCALHAIATDIHLLSSALGQSPHVDASEMQRAMNLSWFDGDQYRTQYVSGGAKALSDEAADLFIRNQLTAFDASVKEETGARMIAVLELCEMALRHNLIPLAADLCRRTWELALGYGQRKDPALSEVMDALEYLQPIAPGETRRLLAEIAPQVHHVLAYTDGKGTRHILAQADELLAKLNRRALTEKYREHTEVGDWYHAENSLKTYVATGDSSSPVLKAVVRTGLHADAVDSLKKSAANGDSGAAHMLAEAQSHIGADVGQITGSRSDNSAEDWKKPFAGDVKTYAVTDFPRLLLDLKEHYGARRDVLRMWYEYWEAQGKGSELVATLEPKLMSANCRADDLVELLDLTFATKLRLEGAAAAFPYIVQAQLFNGGWLGTMHERREASEARLRLVVDNYPRRCDEFFLKSAFSWYSTPRRTRVIPSDIMVFFLGLQGRTDNAVRFTEAMVRSVQEDTRTLRLETPDWAKTLLRSSGDAP